MSTERKTTEDNHIGKNLAELRKRKGWTQEELAEKSDTSRRQIQNLEAGKKKPSPATLARLEAALDVPSGTLTSESIQEASVFFEDAKTDAVTEAVEWLLKNLSNDSPNTRALSLMISEKIDESHSLVRGIMEHFGYTTTYIPTFDYTSETYRECINVMKEFDAKSMFTSFYRSWDILTEDGLDFDAIFKEEEEKYINEKLNYPLLIHSLEENAERFQHNPSLIRTFPLDVRITKNDKIIGQLTLHKFLVLSNRIKTAIDDTILSADGLQEHPERTASLIPNLDAAFKMNDKIKKQKQNLIINEDDEEKVTEQKARLRSEKKTTTPKPRTPKISEMNKKIKEQSK